MNMTVSLASSRTVEERAVVEAGKEGPIGAEECIALLIRLLDTISNGLLVNVVLEGGCLWKMHIVPTSAMKVNKEAESKRRLLSSSLLLYLCKS